MAASEETATSCSYRRAASRHSTASIVVAAFAACLLLATACGSSDSGGEARETRSESADEGLDNSETEVGTTEADDGDDQEPSEQQETGSSIRSEVAAGDKAADGDAADGDAADEDASEEGEVEDEVEVAGTSTVPVSEEESIANSIIFPGAEWETVDPADAGFDADGLDLIPATADVIGSTCVTVTRNGRLVYEWYADDVPADGEVEIFSATKSMASTLVGIAEDEGLLDIDDKASDYITEWQGTDSEDVTIRNLLSNDSGRFYDFTTDYVDMATGALDKTAFSVALDQQHDVGEVWEYNNSAIQTLEEVLQAAIGDEDVASWGEEMLLAPIGMENSLWGTDAEGNAMTFMGVKSNCRDLARFGTLFLADGNWDGTQVVPEAWVAEATEPSQELNSRYGFLWWLNTPVEPDPEQEIEANAGDVNLSWPDVAESTYAAQGLGGQVIEVQPDTGIVLTRMGSVNNANSGIALNALNPILMDAFTE